ncbi:MAG: hypothetical protein RL243_1196 [Actinomycetota bacterium]|jgi:hypothetical protein
MTTKKPAAAKAATTTAAKPAAKTTAATATAAKPAAAPAKKPVAKKPAAKPAAKSSAEVSAPVATDAPRKRYRMLTGIDDSAFCQKVSDALDDGYELYGSPTMTTKGANVYVGQAVVLKKLPKKNKK